MHVSFYLLRDNVAFASYDCDNSAEDAVDEAFEALDEERILIYAFTKRDVRKIEKELKIILREKNNNRIVNAVYGGEDITIEKKGERINQTRNNEGSILVTNGAGARGLDIPDLPIVIMFSVSQLIIFRD